MSLDPTGLARTLVTARLASDMETYRKARDEATDPANARDVIDGLCSLSHQAVLWFAYATVRTSDQTAVTQTGRLLVEQMLLNIAEFGATE